MYVTHADGCAVPPHTSLSVWFGGTAEPLAPCIYSPPNTMDTIKDGSGTHEADQTDSQSGKEGTYSTDEEARLNFEANRLKEQEDSEKEEDDEEDDQKKSKKSKDDEDDEEDDSAQQTGKDARHATQKINEEVRKKTLIAEKLLEKDADAIYEIAEDDPKLAAHLLRRHTEYGASTVEELVKNRDLEDADLSKTKKVVVKTTDEVAKLQKKLVDSEIRRLRGDNPDLDGELEDTFREMVQHPDYEDLEPERILAVARAFLGKESPQKTSKASDVAEEMLNAAQGSMPSAGSRVKKDTESESITPSMRRMMQGMGLSEDTVKRHAKQGHL